MDRLINTYQNVSKSSNMFPFRVHKVSMKNLKLLSDSSKARRNRRNVLNILVTILSWLVEFFGSFTVFLGSFIFGHSNSSITLSLQTMTMLIYFIILPLTILVNGVKFKSSISESRWYLALIQAIGCGLNKVEPS